MRGDDEGIWRRMRLVPWTVTIPEAERDPLLPAKLRAELPGILAWAVRGCLAWQQQGLAAPDAVTTATSAYRSENDVLGQFLDLHVVFEQGATISRKTLREAYATFCAENGAEPLGAKRFAARLRERGVTEASVRAADRVVDGWRHVRMATDVERATASAWGRRDEGTCRGRIPDNTYARDAHLASNPVSNTTTPYVPTSDSDGEPETFDAYLKRERVSE